MLIRWSSTLLGLTLLASCTTTLIAPRVPDHPTPVAPVAPRGPSWLAIRLDYESLAFGGLRIVKMTDDAVSVVADELDGGSVSGWLDAHTFIVGRKHDDALEITHYVDGVAHAGGTVEIASDGGRVELVITASHEAWLFTCAERSDEKCAKPRYRRIAPAPALETTQAPVERAPLLAPTVAAPPRGALTLTPVDIAVLDTVGRGGVLRHEQVPGVRCDLADAHATYPVEEWASLWQATSPTSITAARWVRVSPPVFEFTERTEPPIPEVPIGTSRRYARACAPAFDDYVWLGDDRWAAFVRRSHDSPLGFGAGEPPDMKGTWTFYRGGAVVGTVEEGVAGALRAP